MATQSNNGNQQQQQPERKLLTPGMYRAKAVDGKMTGDDSKGYQYAVMFMLLEGPDSGKHIAWWGGFKGGGVAFTMGVLKTLGCADPANTDFTTWKPTGEVNLVLEDHVIPATPKNPNSRKVTRVKFVNSLDGKGGPSLEKVALKGDAAKAASSKMNALFAAVASGGPAPSGDAGGGGGDGGFDMGGEGGDDDLPF